MFCAVDVHYGNEQDPARAACVQFETLSSALPFREHVVVVPHVEPYVPGEFFRRELPPLLSVLRAVDTLPALVIVDGYVWLDKAGKPGLGARLHEALGGQVAVIGVAKTAYRGETGAFELLRGKSTAPLYISAMGIPLEDAVTGIRGMHGAHRIPTMLLRVDHLARGLIAVKAVKGAPT